MTNLIYELALGRAMDYLTRCGNELTPATLEQVLEIIEDASKQGEEDLLNRVMDDLSNHFEVRMLTAPSPAPSLNRKSMGYV